MFNVAVDSMIEWPDLPGLDVYIDDESVLSLSRYGGVVHLVAMRNGFAQVTIKKDDGFFLVFSVRVVDSGREVL